MGEVDFLGVGGTFWRGGGRCVLVSLAGAGVALKLVGVQRGAV